MERLDSTLTDCLERCGKLPDEVSYSVIRDIAVGLRYLHGYAPNPIVHRDLTANNILLTSDIKAKISDLGVAKILNLNPARMVQMTTCPGTPSYMPPEALVTKPIYTTKVDVFSYGNLLTHVFSGVWPIPAAAFRFDPSNPNVMIPATEVERREEYLQDMGDTHPLIALTRQCLSNNPLTRPEAPEILAHINEVVPQFPPSFQNKVEMLQQIEADHNEKRSLTSQIEEKQWQIEANSRTLTSQIEQHQRQIEEKDRQIAHLEMSHSAEREGTRTQVSKLHSEIEGLRDKIRVKDKLISFKHQQVQEAQHIATASKLELLTAYQQLTAKDQVLAAKDKELSAKDQQLYTKHQELTAKDRQLASKYQQLAAKDQQLAAKDQQLAAKDQEVAAKDQELAAKDQQLSAKDQELAAKRQQVEAKQKEVAAKDHELLSLAQELAATRSQLSAQQSEISSLREEIASKESTIMSIRKQLESLLKEPCTNQGCGQIREDLQRRVKELENAFSAPKCIRPDCQKLHKQLREKDLQIIGKASPGDDMEKQRGGDHDELIEEFEYLTTDPDGILRVPEGILGQFEAKRLLSVLFQCAYDKCRNRVVRTLCKGLISGLFTVLTSTPEKQGTWDLEGASRGFGLLLHAFALKTENMKTEACVTISQEICNDFKGDPSFSNVQSALQSGCADWLERIVQLTWKFTTLPTPLIMCQPDKFNDQIHGPQFGHWDKRKQKINDYTLVYLRPVVYENYHGKRACKGWVAMEGVHEEVEKKVKAGTRTQSGGKDQGGSWWPSWSR